MENRTKTVRPTRKRAARKVRLTWRELQELSENVAAKVKADKIPNVVSVGLGYKNPYSSRRGAPSLLFVVKRKVPGSRLEKHQQVGKQKRLAVVVGTGSRKRTIHLATDVLTVDQVTAEPVTFATVGSIGTAGPVLRLTSNAGVAKYAILTAGHVLLQVSGKVRLAALAACRQVAMLLQANSVLYKPDNPSTAEYDIGLVEVTEAQARELIGKPAPAPLPPYTPAKDTVLERSNSPPAHDGTLLLAFPTRVNIDIQAIIAFHNDKWPNLKFVFSYIAFRPRDDQRFPFFRGTSGACVVDPNDNPIGLHVAANTHDYSIGYAQPIEPILGFIVKQLNYQNAEVIGYCS